MTTIESKPLVFLAAPFFVFTAEDVNRLVRVSETLLADTHNGVLPVIPHINMLYDMAVPKTALFWQEYAQQMLLRCDALIAVEKGVTFTSLVSLATENGIPAYDSPYDFVLAYTDGSWKPRIHVWLPPHRDGDKEVATISLTEHASTASSADASTHWTERSASGYPSAKTQLYQKMREELITWSDRKPDWRDMIDYIDEEIE